MSGSSQRTLLCIRKAHAHCDGAKEIRSGVWVRCSCQCHSTGFEVVTPAPAREVVALRPLRPEDPLAATLTRAADALNDPHHPLFTAGVNMQEQARRTTAAIQRLNATRPGEIADGVKP